MPALLTNPTHAALPPSLVQGDAALWRVTPAQQPNYLAADDWFLRYSFVNSSFSFRFDSVPAVEDHEFLVESSVSITWPAGDYSYQLQALNASGLRLTIGNGRFVVTPDYSSGTNFDARSSARRALENVTAVIENRATSATSEYEIAGRKLKYISVSELLQLRDKLRLDVAREDAATAQASGVSTGVRGRILIGLR